jgi:hypothetical protein
VNHSCHKKSVNKEFIETLVINEGSSSMRMGWSRLTEAIYAAQFGENPRLGELEGKIADLDRKMSNLINAIEGGMAYEGLKERYGTQEEGAVPRTRGGLDNPLSKDQIQYALLRFQTADIEARRLKALIWAFINSVYLYDDKGGYALVNFNYKGHSKKVMLGNMGSDMKRLVHHSVKKALKQGLFIYHCS